MTNFELLQRGEITSDEYVRRIKAETRRRMRENPPRKTPRRHVMWFKR